MIRHDNFIHYKTGIQSIDDDHWKLISMMNDIIDQLNEDIDVSHLLSKFTKELQDHFNREELEMIKINFPYYKFHKQEHIRLANEMTKINLINTHIIEKLELVLIQHIDTYDMQIGTFNQ